MGTTQSLQKSVVHGQKKSIARRHPSVRRFLFTLLFTVSVALNAAAGPPFQWTWRNPHPFNSQLNAVVSGNGLWVVAGSSGMLATSPDGVDWDLVSVGPPNVTFSSAAFGNGQMVIAATLKTFVSTNGHNWSQGAVGFNDIAFGNGIFAGVNSDGSVSTSGNGINWTNLLVNASAVLTRISYANGRYFATGNDFGSSSQSLYWSLDAKSWSGAIALGTNGIQKVVYGNGVYLGINNVTTANSYWSTLRTSVDGATWSAPQMYTNHLVTDALFVGGRFIAVDETENVWFSTNGVAWTTLAAPELFGVTRLATDGNGFVASSILGRIVSSADGTNWVRRTTGPQNSLVAVTRQGNLYVAVGGNLVPGVDPYSSPTVVTSTNGRDWVEHDPATTNSLLAVAATADRYVAVGTNGAIVTSLDATNWTAVGSPVTNTLFGIAYGNGRFVAVGSNTNRATIITSTDGLTWTNESATGNYTPLFGITYAMGQFVAVGQTNASRMPTVLTSPDGLAWTAQTTTATNILWSVGSGNGLFIAVGDRNTIITSPDGVVWTNLSLSGVTSLRSIAYGNGWYAALATVPVVFTSSNAVNWSSLSLVSTVTLQGCYAIIAGDNAFFITGYEGQVLESNPFNVLDAPPAISLRWVAGRPFLAYTNFERHGYEIQGADVLPSWQALLLLTNYNERVTLPVAAITNNAARFYRLKLLN